VAVLAGSTSAQSHSETAAQVVQLAWSCSYRGGRALDASAPATAAAVL